MKIEEIHIGYDSILSNLMIIEFLTEIAPFLFLIMVMIKSSSMILIVGFKLQLTCPGKRDPERSSRS
jgi:hypothetical protein